MSNFMLDIMRMSDEELIEYLVELVEDKTVMSLYSTNRDILTQISKYEDIVDSIKNELLRRM